MLDYILHNRIEVLAALITLVCVFLNIRQNIWGWFFGMIAILLYVYVFYKAMLIGDFLLQIYFFISSVYGLYEWRYGKEKSVLPVSALSKRNFLKIMFLGVLLSGLFGRIFSTYPDASLPYWDATTTAYSVIAQILLARKKIENWLLWILVNTLCVGIYFYKELYASSILYFLLLLMAFRGYWAWKKDLIFSPKQI